MLLISSQTYFSASSDGIRQLLLVGLLSYKELGSRRVIAVLVGGTLSDGAATLLGQGCQNQCFSSYLASC